MYEEYFEELDKLDEDYLMEMAVVAKEDSELSYDIWLDKAGHQRNVSQNKS